jgi:hypothetical protein
MKSLAAVLSGLAGIYFIVTANVLAFLEGYSPLNCFIFGISCLVISRVLIEYANNKEKPSVSE